MKRVLVVGDLLVVVSGRAAGPPRRGENLMLRGSRMDASGVAGNMGNDLAKLGADAWVAGAVGKDVLGSWLLSELRAKGVTTDEVARVQRPTGVLMTIVESSGERTMIASRGASESVGLDPGVLGRSRPDWVHISGYTLTNERARATYPAFVSEVRRSGIPISVDLEGIAQAGIRIDLRGVTAFCNSYEYGLYFRGGSSSARPAARALVVKRGSAGAYLVEDSGRRRIPPVRKKVVDATGAGDAFNSGFIWAKLQGKEDYEACLWGNACGSDKAGVPGPFLVSVNSLQGLLGG